MYHVPNRSIVHNEYQHFFGAPLCEPVIGSPGDQPKAEPSLISLQAPVYPPKGESVRAEPRSVKSKSKGASKQVGESAKRCVDTSSFTVEQRVVAAAWVHERHYTHTSIGQIKQQFVKRFGRPAPAKNTLLVWEQKLFSSGSVHDAPRTGRPAKRQLAAGSVAASLRAAPALSLRARAAALRVPPSTLRALLRRLPHLPKPKPKPKPKPEADGPVKPKAPRPAPPAGL